MVRPGGYYLLHTPINGYFGHGLHVFNPHGLIDCFVANGFKIVYLKYSTDKGKAVSDPSDHRNVLLWLVGKKEKEVPFLLVRNRQSGRLTTTSRLHRQRTHKAVSRGRFES